MNDATPFSQTGYVGEDVEMCIYRLLQNADFDVARAQNGIVFIDEIDKIARKSDASNPNQRDVGGEGVQQGLLRMLEGTTVHLTIKPGAVPGKRNSPAGGETVAVDTSNILFIVSGAFVGLEKIIQDRIGSKSSIGFGAPLKKDSTEETGPENIDDLLKDNVLHQTEPSDLVKFGFIPEFIGRLPVIASSDPLGIDHLEKVLLEPKNAIIKQFKEICHHSNM